jgi:sulfide:quinone oxidoreductase
MTTNATRQTLAEPRTGAERNQGDGFKVVVAGAGIGGLEAILALREICGDSLEIELLSPEEAYRLAPLSVLEPFGASGPREVPLDEFCEEHDVELTRDGLAEVWPGSRRILTERGTEIYYDALLLSIGARRRPVLEDAISFRGSADVAAIEGLVSAVRDGGGRIAFVSPPEVEWTLPLYELALLTADRVRATAAEIELLTSERRPLEAFGPSASELVAGLLGDAGVVLRTGVEDPVSLLEPSRPDHLVSLPELWMADIPGVAQHRRGFIPVDARMAVSGAERIWAVGDATWSPIKQGGLAAQQADIAAAGIAALAGAAVVVPPYVPVLRAALMTADGPYYLRSGSPDADGELRAPLWWPPAKVAGRLLAPYLSRRMGALVEESELVDLPLSEGRDADHREAFELSLRWADLDAREGDPRRALHWLEVAESLELALPSDYERKREEWRAKLDTG